MHGGYNVIFDLFEKEKVLNDTHLIIQGMNRLKGEVEIDGSKNSVLPLIAATSLTKDIMTLKNVPNILDTSVMCEMLTEAGGSYNLTNNTLTLANNIKNPWFSQELASKVRASILFLGPILAAYGEISIPLPGGDKIGYRPIDIHLDALEEMGAEIVVTEGVVHAKAKSFPLKGAPIFLKFPSVGATQNIMMAATLARGETCITNAAKEPEIVDLAQMLNKMGAKVYGAGTNTIRIVGVSSLNGTIHDVIPDRLETGTLLIASAITGGKVILKNTVPEHNTPIMAILRKIGVQIEVTDQGSIAVFGGNIKRSFKASALPYPGLPTDLQPLLTALAIHCPGVSEIQDNIYSERFSHVAEMMKMGASIHRYGNVIQVTGGQQLKGSTVSGGDIRTVTSLICTSLMAEGQSKIFGLEHLYRGHGGLVEKLNGLGADILFSTTSYSIMETTGDVK